MPALMMESGIGNLAGTLKRRPLSIDMSMVARPVEAGTVAVICDGEPGDAAGYAEKLSQYRNLSAFRPYLELAENFGTVVSSAELENVWDKLTVLDGLYARFGPGRFREICKTLELDADSVIGAVGAGEGYRRCMGELAEQLVPFLKCSNVGTYISYIGDCIEEMLAEDPIDEVLRCYCVGMGPACDA